MHTFDAIIIGTGQAGPALAHRLKNEGKTVAIIEKDKFGGTCVNDGCTPTKAYVASARRAFIAKNSADHGISFLGEVQIDLKKIKARKDKLVKESTEGVEASLREADKITVFTRHGRFIDGHTVEVDGQQLKADQIFINTGGRARLLDNFENVNYLTNSSILELTEVPKHLVIIGGGYIGLEFSQMFRRFGSEVTIVEMKDKLLSKADDDVAEEISEILKSEGIKLRLGAKCINGRQNKDGSITVGLDCDNPEKEVTGSHVLVAVGRVPNTDDLGLEKAGVKTNDKGFIEVNNHLQTTVPHIYAMGDCNGEGAFTHTTYNDFEIVANHLFDGGNKTLNDRITCYAAFIDPPFAQVGLSEKEVKEKGIAALKTKRPMSRIARAKEMGETKGFLKMIVDKSTNKFLGATFLGTGADEYIHTVLDLMYADAEYTVMQNAVHIHPTVSELLPTILGELEEM